jgi:predicted lipoprotein with Yx(FWY)xxD motif
VHRIGEHNVNTARKILGRVGWSVAAVAAVMLVAAACGGGGTSYGAGGYGAGSSPTTSGGGSMAAVVGLRDSGLGQTLVDDQGRTLYLFEADTAGKSNCHGACTSAWPPYLSTGAPKAGTGVAGGLLGTIRGDGGGAQVTYHGHPLYRYAGDSQPGDTAGQGLDQFGARWYVIAPNGDEVVNH